MPLFRLLEARDIFEKRILVHIGQQEGNPSRGGENMRLNPKAFGLALGIVAGAAIFILTLWTAAIGGGGHLYLLRNFYFGYSVSAAGAVLGLIYGFIDGFIGGAILAWLYNKCLPSSSA
jgi:hypothetical protein